MRTAGRDQGEAAARSALSCLAPLQQTDLVAVVVTDADGRVKDANDAFYRLLGYRRDEPASPASIPTFFIEADADALATGDPVTFEQVLTRKDGSSLAALVRAKRVGGSNTDVVAVIFDGWTQRRSDAALRESEERLRLLVEHVGDAVFMLDPEGRVVTWTPSAQRIFGYTADEALMLRAESFYPREDRERGVPASDLDAALRSGRFECDAWRVCSNGRRLWAHVVTCPIRGASSELRGFAKIVQDRTALRAAEELLSERAGELQRSNKDLEAFASIAAHDLQEPLRKLRTFGDRLKKRFASSVDADATALVDRMSDAAARMQLLIDGLLNYSRAGRRSQSFGPVDLNLIAGEVVADLSAAIEKSGGTIEIGPLPTVFADPTHMRQLLQNLLSNALKFARPGVPPTVKLAGTHGDRHWELVVADNGIGFEPKYAERIFGLFQRLHGGTEYEGSGMGLAICRRIIERHGGTITAEGLPGQSAIFKVTLPESPDDTYRSGT